ncbi:uncharacterized protein VTP21DRAFT_10577 [Calcarisporiella thermophila]|uniref:uncharacterized protein n=1 Tax=Calcarisporiella thermophila TaxID=911321 RepID=UPI003742D8B2
MSSSFIGSKISLVSNSLIRYVGILHAIDPEKSTVSLAQVRSFGTEGRKGNPAEEIPPSDNVFEYIVFRGADVKDLQVFESPAAPQPQQPQVPNDPAIVGTTAPTSAQPGLQGGYQQHPPMMGNIPPSQPYAPNPYMANAPGWQQQQPQAYWQQPQHAQQFGGPAVDATTQQNVNAADADEARKSQAPTAESVEQLAKKISGINMGKENKDQGIRMQNQNETRNQQYQPSHHRRGGRGGQRRYAPRPVNVPTSDFDFESANAKFDKSEIVRKATTETGGHVAEEDGAGGQSNDVVEIPSEPFYDKKKSFFDNISCESKETTRSSQDRRQRANEERRLNMETFGQADAGRRGGYRRGGGGRGGYHRGGYQRGGYHHRGGYRSLPSAAAAAASGRSASTERWRAADCQRSGW